MVETETRVEQAQKVGTATIVPRPGGRSGGHVNSAIFLIRSSGALPYVLCPAAEEKVEIAYDSNGHFVVQLAELFGAEFATLGDHGKDLCSVLCAMRDVVTSSAKAKAKAVGAWMADGTFGTGHEQDADVAAVQGRTRKRATTAACRPWRRAEWMERNGRSRNVLADHCTCSGDLPVVISRVTSGAQASGVEKIFNPEKAAVPDAVIPPDGEQANGSSASHGMLSAESPLPCRMTGRAASWGNSQRADGECATMSHRLALTPIAI
ncbi:hypothetical protein K469DRAFT_760053 [Zopfia rhizophila CBS 207.26]|uniref:Uncharacterized protein n=1 Tax=Zopfia rhizophila CBS 207.26 TaxID=1314779 RepID=A0A6A6EFL8_9PEZI|nr:hypothetical protein K469DRAFT_760053 [Zopfia rhizophila CBS 207.26]